MRLLNIYLVAVLVSLAVASCQQSGPVNPLVGAWTVVEIQQTGADGKIQTFQGQPGLSIFTKSHYSTVHVPGPAARQPFAKRWEPTPDEIRTAYESIIVNSGTYAVSGSRLIVRPVIAKTPEFAGGHGTYEYKIDRDTLSLEAVELQSYDGVRLPVSFTIRLRRAE